MSDESMLLRVRGRVVEFPRRPLVMGIVNVNDDSFSGDGTLDFDEAVAIAVRQVADGADMIDVGGESARTNRGPVSVHEEIRRLRGFIERFAELRGGDPQLAPRSSDQIFPPILSVNTWRPDVVEAVLPHGVDLLNDLGGLPDDRNARLAARHGAALLIMHLVGEPKVPHTHVDHAGVWPALDRFFAGKIALALAAGLARDQLVLDPGIDFAKQCGDNLDIYRHLERLARFGRPVLLPISRKTMIGNVLGLPDPSDRDAGTIACLVAGQLRGASIFRVHNVRAAAQAVRVIHRVASPADARPTWIGA